MTTAVHTKGIQLQLALDGLDANLATIVGVHNIAGPNFTRNMIDGTDFGSPDGWREFIKGLKDGGEVTFQINWKPSEASHMDVTGILKDLEEDDAIALWALKFPPLAAVTTWKFNAAVTSFGLVHALDDRMVASVTLKVTKKPDPFNA